MDTGRDIHTIYTFIIYTWIYYIYLHISLYIFIYTLYNVCIYILHIYMASLVAQLVKNLPTMQENPV